MMRSRRVAAALSVIALVGAAPPTKPQKSPEAILKELGASVIRDVDYDICFPADAREYEALGKNAVIKLTASTAIATELPLRSAYLEVKGVRVPLHRISLVDPRRAPRNGEEYVEQASFYLVPISLLKMASDLEVDFTGERRAFGVAHFTKKSGVEGAPSFVRLDEYDAPADPDPRALQTLLAREYPEDFPA